VRRFLLLAVAALAGCGDPRDPAADLIRRQGRTQAFAAAALVRAKPADGESLQLTLSAWRGQDGAVKVLVTKADVDVLEARLDVDGLLRLWSPRQRETCTTRLDANEVPALLARLPLLLRELSDGPLAPQAAPVADGRWTWQEDDLAIAVALAGDQPRSKTVTDPQGQILVTLTYGATRAFDALLRPDRVTITVPDGEALVLLRRLDALGDVSAERLRLTIPDDAIAVPFPTLLEHLKR